MVRRHVLLLAAAVMVGCSTEPPPRLPPTNRFYFPTGIAHADVPGSTHGALYVASSNFDKCYDFGQLTALSLDSVPGLPALRSFAELDVNPKNGRLDAAERPSAVMLTDLPVAESERRIIQSYAGEMALWTLKDAEEKDVGTRIFVPARAEGSPLHVVDAAGPSRTSLSCVGDETADNCFHAAPSLEVAPEGGQDGLPAAPGPLGVAVGSTGFGEGMLFVTHIEPATRLSDTSDRRVGYNFVVETKASVPAFGTDSFVPMPSGADSIQSVAVGKRFAYVTARRVSAYERLVQLVDLDPVRRHITVDGQKVIRVLPSAIGLTFRATMARGLALSADERRLYVAVRGESGSDVLLVANIIGPEEDVPSLQVVRAVPLAPGASQVRIIPRANGNLVLVTSEGELADSTHEGSLTVYDDGVGQVVAEIANVGKQPYGIAVDLRQTPEVTKARIFVSLFGEGRVAVIDMPDVMRPDVTVPVAYLGARQVDSNVEGRQSAICGVGE